MSYDRSTITGKATILTTLLGVFVLFLGLVVELPHSNKVARADSATTSVTVLNTPPTWTIDAQETPESSTSSPTNSGSAVTWTAVANDSSNDDYYLLICKTVATPTANANAAPTCSGGISNLWAVSARTASNATATVATTTTEGFAESNVWAAYICDHNVSSACNSTVKQGSGSGASPFNVNHRPTFTVFSVSSSISPGGTVSWSSTSSDSDVVTSNDTVQLFVCRANDFTGSACGAGGTWCQSGASSTDPYCQYTTANPYPDAYYAAYGYIIDNHGHAASAGAQGSQQRMTVNNAAPSITAASISLLDTDDTGPLTLTSPGGQTSGFEVRYTVTDQNSCQTASSTSEVTSGYVNVYRSGVTSNGCDQSSEYNANNCYPGLATTTLWALSCTASSTSCLGNTDSDVIWSCTFPLWYLAESTDGTGIATDPPNFAQNWIASAVGFDDNSASSSKVDGTVGTELNSFLAYDVATTTISYGGLQPGQQNDPIDRTTDLQAVGNVGLDQTLYGADMCPTYPTCTGNATSTIFVNNQRYGTSSIAYASATTLLANPGATLNIRVQKTTATATPQTKNTYWGIAVPGTITLSGDYFGVNTLIGVTSPSASW